MNECVLAEGNCPGRRILPLEATSQETRAILKVRLHYVGSRNHKLHPGDYGFVPSHNPRPSKSACDELRAILLPEAIALFERGIELGMVSSFEEHSIPKYVWSVDALGEVFEAKSKPGQEDTFHGYRIGDDERIMRLYVIAEWNKRCQKS